ncbi:uncharacterized protein LOC111347300 [Stylophora pistillata]|uniref:uncharacterized protein LOC111347300 n=1 Tax=Stylophora pistillata TaxID=50429 RepID=UPI000C04E884|nr:uncharacterized protein LOC111347300 [Stylophora pistillata]
MNREQFLLDRKKGIGGSDCAAILGVSPWRTPLDVYNDKLSPDISDEPNEDMRRGILAEEFVLKEYVERTGEFLKTNIPTIISNEYPFMRANIDALAGDNIVVEAKTTKANMSAWENGIPEYYKAQVAYYAMLTNAERVDIPVLFSCWEYACFTYWRDEEYESRIKKAVIEFWQEHIIKNIPPKPKSSEELKVAYPNIDEALVKKADDHIRHVVSEYQEVSDQVKKLEEEKESLKNTILVYMENAGQLDAGFCKLALRDRTINRLDTQALKKQNPEIYQNYLKETHSRFLQFMRG